MRQLKDNAILDEEGQRSIERRGLMGHFITGAYRMLMRPTMKNWYIFRAHLHNYLWDPSDVALMLENLPQRHINAVLRSMGATIAEESIVGEGIRLVQVRENGFAPLKVGHKAWFARQVMLDLTEEIIFGDCSSIGNRTMFITQNDLGHSPIVPDLYPVTIKPIYVGRGAFVGPGTVVTHGVTIGECAVIGANSVVTRDIPPYTLAAGSPAKVIRPLDVSRIREFDPSESDIIPPGTTPVEYAKTHPDYEPIIRG